MTALFDRQLDLLARALTERGITTTNPGGLEAELRETFGHAPWQIPADFEPVDIARGLDDFLLLARPESLTWLPAAPDLAELVRARAGAIPGLRRADALKQLVAEWTAGRTDLAKWRRQAELIGALTGPAAPGVAHIIRTAAAVEGEVARLTRLALRAMARAERDDALEGVRRAAGLRALAELEETSYDGNKVMVGNSRSRAWASDGYLLVHAASLAPAARKLINTAYRGSMALAPESNAETLWKEVIGEVHLPGQVLGWTKGYGRGRSVEQSEFIAYVAPLAPEQERPVATLDAKRLNFVWRVTGFDGVRLGPSAQAAVVFTRGDEPLAALMPVRDGLPIDLPAARARAGGQSARQIMAAARHALDAAEQVKKPGA